ncbi:hydroxyethylthiazole kinase, partial [Bacillus atrophaeus]
VIVITGEVDVIADTSNVDTVHNGHKMLTKVTGAGCLLTYVVGAFCAIEENPLFAAIAAISSYGVAAQLAAQQTADKGPGSFQIELLNRLSSVTGQDVQELATIERVTVS